MKQGVLDFYMTIILIVGGVTILYGVYRGRKKGSEKFRYQEQMNQLKLDELNLEREKVRLLYEIEELEDEEEEHHG